MAASLGHVYRGWFGNPFSPFSYIPLARRFAASNDLFLRLTSRYEKPRWNIDGVERTVELELHAGIPASACLTSPIEEDRDPLTLDGRVVTIPLGTSGLETIRVRFLGSDRVENG